MATLLHPLKTSRLFYRCFEQLAKPGIRGTVFFDFTAIAVALLRMLSYLLIRLPEQPLKWYEQRVGLRNCHTSCTRRAQTLANSTENPWTLIDQVSSPGGTTVAGIVELENNAFISTVIKGIEATILRDQELAKQD